ncbi:MAG TPA: hypothetical protein VHB21_04745 [Minicystis sp.]|nr:hypothetical protein [Minicystis sp.]
MCRRVTCPKCQKPTFAGCGAHVEQVLGDVPVEERCACKTAQPPAQGPGIAELVSSWFRKKT